MNEHKSVPNIRFKGFEDEWKKSELKEIAKIVGGGTPDTNNSSYWHGNINWYSPNEIGKYPYVYSSHKKITNLGLKKSSAKLHPSEKTILFTSRAGIGDMAILKTEAATNQGFQSLELKDNIYPYFVYSYGFKIKKEAIRVASGSTFLEISKKDIEKINLWFPSIKEQQKIGDFFSKLDKLLDLQQQKINKLELLKKALLQKLFPKHDGKIPELRFKSYEKNWTKYKLKEVSKIIGGGTPDTKNSKYWNGNINWFSPNEIGDSPYAVSSHKKITDLGLKKSSAKLHPAGRTILFTSRAGIGDMAILTTPAATNQGFQSLELNDNVCPYFVYSYGFEIKKKANRLASGSTFLEISKNQMEKITLMFPSEKEQQKIGNLLSKVDQLIELENKKLHNLQQVKKCLLQNMFVE